MLLSSGIVAFSYASIESEAEEDLSAGCRSDQTLVYRFAYKDFVCVEPSTAKRWVELGFAEIKQDHISVEDKKNTTTDYTSYETKYPGAPPLPPQKSTTTDVDSECRHGQILVYRFTHHDTFCTNSFTALTWERLGLAEIVKDEIPSETTSPVSQDDVFSKTIVSEKHEIDNSDVVTLDDLSDLTFVYTPEIHPLAENIWVAVNYDTTNSVLIEGDTGLIVIDTLSSYKHAKKLLLDFRTLSDKPVKTIIYTQDNPGLVNGSKAFLEEGDGSVEIIAHDKLLGSFNNTSYSDVNPTHVFSSEFLLDISGVKLNLLHVGDEFFDSYYIFLPDHNRVFLSNSEFGLSPSYFEMSYLESVYTMILDTESEADVRPDSRDE